MRVNVDSSVITDPRFRLMAKRLGVTWREAIGSCLMVWMACYERRSERLSVEEIDIASEIDGFAKAMVGVGLAHLDKTNQHGAVIHGVSERIKFLNKQRVRGSKGGKASWAERSQADVDDSAEANASADAEANASADAEANAYQSAEANASASACGVAEAYPLSLPLSPSPSLSHPEQVKSSIGGHETASPGINPTENTTDLGLLWCFRTRAVGRKPTAAEVAAALDAMIVAGSITLEDIRAEWTSERFDWSQTFGNWRTGVMKAKEQRDKKPIASGSGKTKESISETFKRIQGASK